MFFGCIVGRTGGWSLWTANVFFSFWRRWFSDDFRVWNTGQGVKSVGVHVRYLLSVRSTSSENRVACIFTALVQSFFSHRLLFSSDRINDYPFIEILRRRHTVVETSINIVSPALFTVFVVSGVFFSHFPVISIFSSTLLLLRRGVSFCVQPRGKYAGNCFNYDKH